MKKRDPRTAVRRLRLLRETLVSLNAPNLRQAAGGSNSADSDCDTAWTILFCVEPPTLREDL